MKSFVVAFLQGWISFPAMRDITTNNTPFFYISSSSTQTAQVSNTKYIDDEYSPSIFRRTALIFKGTGDIPKTAYVAYKPVVFGGLNRYAGDVTCVRLHCDGRWVFSFFSFFHA
jgi:hypothetical protein